MRLFHVEELPGTFSVENLGSSPICFSHKWRNAVPAAAVKMDELRKVAPEAFLVIDGREKDDCLDSSKLSADAKSIFDRFLAEIDVVAPEALHPVSHVEMDVSRASKAPENTQLPELGQRDSTVTAPVKAPPLTAAQKSWIFRASRDDLMLVPMRNEDRTLGHKILRSSAFIMPATAGVLYHFLSAGPTESHWSDHPWSQAGQNFITHLGELPAPDKDSWSVNFLGHPYAGTLYYNFYRSQGASPLVSSLITGAHSTFHEYFLETFFERPSTQDMLSTWLMGSLEGEILFRASGYIRDHYQRELHQKNIGGVAMNIALFIVDPAYYVNQGNKRLHKIPTN